MSFKLTLDFATIEDRDSFLGWFLDGGGEYEFNESRESDGEQTLNCSGPAGGNYEWPADIEKCTAENYTIELREYEDD